MPSSKASFSSEGCVGKPRTNLSQFERSDLRTYVHTALFSAKLNVIAEAREYSNDKSFYRTTFLADLAVDPGARTSIIRIAPV